MKGTVKNSLLCSPENKTIKITLVFPFVFVFTVFLYAAKYSIHTICYNFVKSKSCNKLPIYSKKKPNKEKSQVEIYDLIGANQVNIAQFIRRNLTPFFARKLLFGRNGISPIWLFSSKFTQTGSKFRIL